VGKPDGKVPLVIPRCRWVDNIKIEFREVEFGGTHWIYLAQDRDRRRGLVNTVTNLQVA
jgi:hypothetical protein